MNYDLHFRLFETVVNYLASNIEYIVEDNAPDNFEAIKDYYAENGFLSIYSGGCDGTIFKNKQSNYAFRAWCDLTHIKLKADFSKFGEMRTFLAQERQILKLDFLSDKAKRICCDILRIEIIGQLKHYQETNSFVDNQK